MKSDDAVSPVVAMMLILAVVVICVSIISATYVPDLKENAEIMHSREVKEKFLEFASDMENIYANARSGVHSYIIPLGGGDIFLSPSRSSGSLSVEINDEEPFGKIQINEDTFLLNDIKITYVPILSFWENQGYKYEKGVVYVTKGDIEVPAQANSEERNDDRIREILKKMEPELIKEIWVNDIHGGTYKKRYYAMNIIILKAGNNYISGSSDALLKIETEKELRSYEIQPGSSITIQGINEYTSCLTNPTDYNPAEVTVTIITATVSVA